MKKKATFAWYGNGLVGLIVAGAAVAQTVPNGEAKTPADVEVCIVAPSIAAEVAKLPAKASQEDYEGAILFSIGQVTCDTPAIIAALKAMLEDPSIGAVERSAIESVIEQLSRRGRGTGAIDTGGGGFGGDGFGSPIVPIGGGSSNYTS